MSALLAVLAGVAGGALGAWLGARQERRRIAAELTRHTVQGAQEQHDRYRALLRLHGGLVVLEARLYGVPGTERAVVEVQRLAATARAALGWAP